MSCGLLCTYNLQVLVVYELLLSSGFLQKTWTKPEPNGGETNKVQAYRLIGTTNQWARPPEDVVLRITSTPEIILTTIPSMRTDFIQSR
jgi:hypothetical protein